MKRITIDAAMLEQLGNLAVPVELYDEAGVLLARVYPQLDPAKWEAVTPEITEEELDRRMKSDGKWYTTAELLAMMKDE